MDNFILYSGWVAAAFFLVGFVSTAYGEYVKPSTAIGYLFAGFILPFTYPIKVYRRKQRTCRKCGQMYGLDYIETHRAECDGSGIG